MEFRLLGPVSLVRDGQPVAIGGPTARAVLALLLLRAGRVVTTDQLVDALWNDEPPRSAVQTIRAYVSRLRRALAEETDPRPRLRSEASGYLLRVEPGELDARTFEVAALAGRRLAARGEWAAAADELAGGLGLWRGPALAGLAGFPALEAEAERLEELRQGALTDRLEADLALGRHAEVIPELEGLIADQPYRERLWGALMLALYRSGRQADALGTYQRARRLLVDELGVEPGPELRSLELAILRQDPSLDPLRTPPGETHLLPAERDSFVGRAQELAHLDRLLHESRMITLTGVGGSGKTRLALRATRDAADRYPDGAWWVELAAVTDPQLVAQLAAAAVGVTAAESKTRDVAQVLVDYLADREALLVLDNCEHLGSAVAGLADAVLSHCPRMRVLATSRETLSVGGEVVVPVPPLDVPPDPAEAPDAFASVRLFLDRARSAAPAFNAGPDDLQRIAEICRRLEGIPLAIELVAARVKVLSPADIATRLDGHLDLVGGGPRTALPRHRSLRATLDWSYGLLDPVEQRLLRRVSVFVGGFSLRAAADVAGAAANEADATLERLAGLVDRSLVQTHRRGSGLRYRLLEPVRQYGLERLGSEDDAEAIRARHAAYCLRLAEEGDAHLRGPEQGAWLENLDAEHANLRAAIDWALDTGRTDLGLQLIGALGWYWFMRGHWAEARRWLDRALADGAGSELPWAQAIYRTGAIEIIRVNLTAMPALVERALEICRRNGDDHGVAWCLHLLGHAAMYRQGQEHQARELLQAGMDAFEALDDAWGYAWSLRYVASTMEEDPERAIGLQQEATQRFREIGDLWSTAFSLYGLGTQFASYDRLSEARAAFRDGRDLCRVLDDRVMAAHNQRGLGLVSLIEGDLDVAMDQFSDARTVLQRAGDENCHAVCSEYLGAIQLRQGDAEAARRELGLSLAGYRSIGREDGISHVLAWLAAVDLAQGEMQRAAVLMGASRWSDVLSGHRVMREQLAEADAEIRRRLGAAAYRRAATRGERMPREEAIRYALAAG